MTEAKISKTAFDAFETATELGIVPKGEKPAQIVDKKSGDQTTYSHDGKTVVTVTPSATPVAKDCQNSYHRFITHECRIHPQIIKTLTEGQPKLPDHLTFRTSPTPQVVHTGEYKLKSVTSEPSGPPLTLNGYSEVPAAPDMQAISKALNKFGPNPKFPTKEDAIAFSKTAMKEGHTLDALLGLLEYGLETGDQLLEQVKEISPTVKTDADAKRFTSSISPRSKEEAVEDVKNLTSLDRSKLKKHAVVDIMQGNIEGQLGHVKEAKRLLVQALTDNPFIVGAYHDLAPLYIREYDMPSAWECYKIGRRLQPNHPVWAPLAPMEKKMEETNPEFF